MLVNSLHPPILTEKDNLITWDSLTTAELPLALANLARTQNQPIIVITPDAHAAEQMHHELKFFAGNDFPIMLFPDRETLPYDHFSPHEDLTSERLRILSQLRNLKTGIVIASVTTLMHRMLPVIFLDGFQFSWKIGDKLNLSHTRQQLADAGYHCTEQVIQHGEYAIRGSIIDIFPMGSHEPYRIELFDDEIETIRTFDVDSQKSIEKIEAINLLPAHEYPLTDEAVSHFRTQWRARFPNSPTDAPIYQQISKKQPIGGIEYYLPLFFEEMATFFDYCPKNSVSVSVSGRDAAEKFFQEVTTRYEQLNIDKTRPLCEPAELFTRIEEFHSKVKAFQQIRISPHTITPAQIDISVDHRHKNPVHKLENFINSHSGKILICAESTGRREIILELFKKAKLDIKPVNDWKEFLDSGTESSTSLYITIAPITSALHLKTENIYVFTETQLFGYQFIPTRRIKKRVQDPDSIIRNLAELQVGALVVHIDHGVGKYVGLEKITTDDIDAEYVTLEYADKDRIYVPIHALHLISRYSTHTENTALNKLGTQQWEKAKKKAAEQIRDIAADLLRIYSERQAATGFQFHKPNDDFKAFRAAFPFEETPDQSKAIDSVIADMTSPKCMDRLVCGDVGFGKTEVAMQAACLATQSGKQVAILAPTTLLANQHAQNFQDRFSETAVKVGVLTRLQSTKNQNETIEKIKEGKLDIIVGTHKLLNQKIEYKDLGLLIIDEEHRFGVQQKERIKSLRAHVDILTLTATPIPRTLNLSMTGMRDLSIIATPPQKRLSIKTFLYDYNETMIREAIIRETMRGGQVYFLHNEVDTMPLMLSKLKNIVPEVSVVYAHGQMPEKQLEKTMSDFYHQRFQVLLTTTIIESGIDIPSANTIIINDANKFGLAQLHQIRGRVGRSHHQAYAYLFVRNQKGLTQDAERRLSAITELEDLGVGFQLATHDLEIRGAGELLGEAQSGQMEAIGFSLYMELLDETVKALKAGKTPPDTVIRHSGPDIDLHICALFPDNYIHDVHTRLMLYKRLSNCATDDAINEMKVELIDRFGLLPEPAQHLFDVAHLRVLSKTLGVTKIEVNKQFGHIYFDEKPNINPAKIIELIQKQFKTYQLAGKNTLRFKTLSDKANERIDAVQKLLDQLKH